MLFKEYSVNQFLDELSSDAPSPGGGSTAALVAALAGSLNSMVYSLTVGKKSFEALSHEEKEKLLTFKEECNKFIKECQSFMEKDREDFITLMASYKLPKETEDEKAERSKVINENTINAMNTPLDIAKKALGFYENITFAVKYGNKNLASDAGVAAILLNSAIESAIMNVRVNLNFLRKEDFFNEVENKCQEIISKSVLEKEKLVKDVYKIIY